MNKFVIIKNGAGEFELRLGVDFHYELGATKENCFGGGIFVIPESNEKLVLMGLSVDFGVPKWYEIKMKKNKIHISEDFANMKIIWHSGYDDDWKPIDLDFTDDFIFDYV